jgi:hypothetical protein
MPPEGRAWANSPLAGILRDLALPPSPAELSTRMLGKSSRSCPRRYSPGKGRPRSGECVAAPHESWSQPILPDERMHPSASMVTVGSESFHVRRCLLAGGTPHRAGSRNRITALRGAVYDNGILDCRGQRPLEEWVVLTPMRALTQRPACCQRDRGYAMERPRRE